MTTTQKNTQDIKNNRNQSGSNVEKNREQNKQGSTGQRSDAKK